MPRSQAPYRVSLADLGPSALRQAVEQVGAQQPKRNKYGAKPTYADGMRFHSKAEAERWQVLSLKQRMGLISDLTRQVEMPLVINGTKIGKFTADFTYREAGELVVEDSKGFYDTAARLRIKVAEACYGIKVRITGAAAKPRKKRAA